MITVNKQLFATFLVNCYSTSATLNCTDAISDKICLQLFLEHFTDIKREKDFQLIILSLKAVIKMQMEYYLEVAWRVVQCCSHARTPTCRPKVHIQAC